MFMYIDFILGIFHGIFINLMLMLLLFIQILHLQIAVLSIHLSVFVWYWFQRKICMLTLIFQLWVVCNRNHWYEA